jgi:hypothetical protein
MTPRIPENVPPWLVDWALWATRCRRENPTTPMMTPRTQTATPTTGPEHAAIESRQSLRRHSGARRKARAWNPMTPIGFEFWNCSTTCPS